MYFLLQLCRELGITIAQGMEMSVFELKTWAAFLKMENQRERDAMKKAEQKARLR